MSDPGIQSAVAEVAGRCMALNARRRANRLARLYSSHLAPSGLEIAQFSTLCIVADGRARTVQAIARYIDADRSTLARNLKILVGRGHLIEERVAGRLEYALSAQGEEKVRAALPLWRSAQADAEASSRRK